MAATTDTMPVNILSWNIQGQNPLDMEFGIILQQRIAYRNPEIVALCEVGESVLVELFAHQWIKFQAELDAIAPYLDQLSSEDRTLYQRLQELVLLQTRYTPGIGGESPKILTLDSTLTIEPRRNRYIDITESLRSAYFNAAVSVRDAHALITSEIGKFKDTLNRKGIIVNWATAEETRKIEKHVFFQKYYYYVQICPQENRHYLVMSKTPITCEGCDEVGGMRPLLRLGCTPNLWFIHCIAARHPAKNQIVSIIEMLRRSRQPAVFFGDLNVDRPVLVKELGSDLVGESGSIEVNIRGCKRPTQNSGGELDYAIGYHVAGLEVRRDETLPGRSDHYPILISWT